MEITRRGVYQIFPSPPYPRILLGDLLGVASPSINGAPESEPVYGRRVARDRLRYVGVGLVSREMSGLIELMSL